MGRVVLVTGVSHDFGGRFARLLADTPGIDRVIGVDVVPPRGDLGQVSFTRADIRNPVIAKVIAGEDVDTVVHMSVIATPGTAGVTKPSAKSCWPRSDMMKLSQSLPAFSLRAFLTSEMV